MINYAYKNSTSVPLSIDETTGQIKGGTYNLPDLYEYRNIAGDVETHLKDWKESKFYEVNKDGSLHFLKPIQGLEFLASKEGVTEDELRVAAMNYLQSQDNFEYAKQQGKIRASNINTENIEGIKQYLGEIKPEWKNKSDEEIKTFIQNGGLEEIETQKYLDQALTLPVSKYSYTKEALDKYDNLAEQEKIKADAEIAKKLKLKELGLLEGSTDENGNPTDLADSSLFTVERLTNIGTVDTATLDYVNTAIEKYSKSYDSAYENYDKLLREFKAGDNSKYSELQKAQENLKAVDKNIAVLNQQRININKNITDVLQSKKVNIDEMYKKYYNSFMKGNANKAIFLEEVLSKKEYNDIVNEYTLAIATGKINTSIFGKGNGNIYDLESYKKHQNKFKKKYQHGIAPMKFENFSDLTNILSDLTEEDKSKLTSVTRPVDVIVYKGSDTKKETPAASKLQKINENLQEKLVGGGRNNFIVNEGGKSFNLMTYAKEVYGIEDVDLNNIVDWGKTSAKPTISYDVQSAQNSEYNPQIAVTLQFKTDENSRKILEKHKELNKQNSQYGGVTIVSTLDKQNGNTLRLELQDMYKQLMQERSSGISKLTASGKADLLEIGQAYSNINPTVAKAFDDAGLYTLPHNTSSTIKTPVGDIKVTAIKPNKNTLSTRDNSFLLSRLNGNTEEIAVTDNTTGGIQWINKVEYDKSLGDYRNVINTNPSEWLNAKYVAYSFETPEDIKGYVGSELLLKETNPNFSNLSYEINKAEKSNNNYKIMNSTTKAAGKYQFMPEWYNGSKGDNDILKFTGLKTIEEFLNSPSKQEEYFEHYSKVILKPEIDKYRDKINKVAQQQGLTSLTDVQIAKALHFWGGSNIKDLITGRKTFNTKIKYGNGLYNPSLKSYIFS